MEYFLAMFTIFLDFVEMYGIKLKYCDFGETIFVCKNALFFDRFNINT